MGDAAGFLKTHPFRAFGWRELCISIHLPCSQKTQLEHVNLYESMAQKYIQDLTAEL